TKKGPAAYAALLPSTPRCRPALTLRPTFGCVRGHSAGRRRFLKPWRFRLGRLSLASIVKLCSGESRTGEYRMIGIFDGHNDCVQRLQEYRADGIDFLARLTDGHLDLPRALDGGLKGAIFAMMARPEHPPLDDLTVTQSSYEVRLAEPLDAAYA